MSKRVVVTGMAGISPLGNDWPTVQRRLREGRNAVTVMEGWKRPCAFAVLKHGVTYCEV